MAADGSSEKDIARGAGQPQTDGPEGREKSATTGSLSRRMISIAAAWIILMLAGGGFALDRVLVATVTRNFDTQSEYVLTAMIASAEIGPDGEVFLNRPLGDQRFLEPNSGVYWQISGKDHADFPSRSLWDRTLQVNFSHNDTEVNSYDSNQFEDEPLRILERAIILPDSETRWIFQVAQAREGLNQQIDNIRDILISSFFLLALGLILMAALQTLYGLWPLRKIRQAIAQMRTGEKNRLTDAMPDEVTPMVEELNALLDHNETQSEEARRHAGNLAHALKTPLTVVMNSATAKSKDLDETVIREATVMRRQVDHHLARARAVGRRGHARSRADVWPSVQAVERAVGTLYEKVRIDIDGKKDSIVAVERQDLDEMLGNLIENAAKYGGGSVFVTVEEKNQWIEILIEDDGTGIPEEERLRIFDRGVRLDTGKPGTGLGLAIVRDVAEIYGGSVALEESEDLGGLLVRLRLKKSAG